MSGLLLSVFVGVALLVAAGIVYTYGRFGRHLYGEPARAIPTQPDETVLDKLAAPELAGNPGETGVSLIDDNIEAFVARAVSSRQAGRSLDLQYYFWKHDLTGRLLTREVLAAADRGVRVRLLLDDINAGVHDRLCLALDAHPLIQVRLFNPSRARRDRFRRGLEMMFRPLSATRRMHNKAWIADGRVVITGGRNIGDAYFDADEAANFRDLDIWMLGPVVDSASAMFDLYWNSAVVLPIGALRTRRARFLPRLKRKLEALSHRPPARQLLAHVDAAMQRGGLFHGTNVLRWTDQVRIVSDPPEKAHLQRRQNWLMHDLMPVLQAGQSDVRIISPYFIPGDLGVAAFGEMVARNVTVSVLTNSLAATDVAAVHGSYANYRRKLLKVGVKLFEMKALQPMTDPQRLSLFGSRSASLHTKAFTVDGKTGFVGSMNFDPRSASLNTEMGVVFTHPDVVADVEEIFRLETAPAASFRLSLDAGRLRWHDEEEGQRRVLRHEPEAGFIRRVTAGIIGILPIESQL